MNIFHKVTLEALRKNRMRTTVTIVGIVLSTSLMTAITTSVSSLQRFSVENVEYMEGKWHSSAEHISVKQYQTLKDQKEVTEIAFAEQIGYAWANSDNEYKPYLYIAGISSNFTDLVSVHVTAGTMPEETDDILLPEHLASNGHVYYSIGDEITLDIGERLRDGVPLYQDTSMYGMSYENDPSGEAVVEEEEIAVRTTRTYTVCGFYERPGFEDYSAPGYTCLTLPDGADMPLDVYYTVKHARDVYDFMDEVGVQGNTHTNLLRLMGVSRFDNYFRVVYGMAAILIGLIMFGSVSLIYNAFAISVSERTKQFGLLSSVGATKKQLRRMVRFEALCVSAIGIPIGVVVGIVGITVTFLCIGGKIVSVTGGFVPMRMHASLPALAIAFFVALVTVLISAWIPSRRSAKVSAVEAIRQSADIKEEKRPIRTPRWIYKVFGLSGMLAQKYFRRSRKKYRATILSLFMSVVLFISASAFTDYLTRSVGGVFEQTEWDIRYYCSEFGDMELEEIKELLLADPNVEEAVCTINQNAMGGTDRAYLSEAGLTEFSQLGSDEYSKGREVGCIVDVIFVSDVDYSALLREYHLSETEFLNPAQPLGIACDNITYFDDEAGKYRTEHFLASDQFEMDALFWKELEGYIFQGVVNPDGVEQALYLSEDEQEELYLDIDEARGRLTFRTGKTIHELPYFVMNSYYPTLIYPLSLMDKVMEGADEPNYVNYLLKAKEHAAAMTTLSKTLAENHLGDHNLYDIAEQQENDRNLVTIVKVFSSGFIVLISLIAAANVFNSVSTNIALRRREFAMLKSVGMTGKGLQNMMNYECILYGTRSLLFGLPVSAGVTVLIYMVVHEGFEAGFYMPWDAVGIAVLSVFAVVFASMLYAMQKIRKDNPIDALKNENL